MGIVMDRHASCVILVNDMVFLVTKDVVLSHRSIWVDNFGLVAHVRSRVVDWILSRVVRVLVIHNRLMMDSFIMLLMVLSGLFVVIVNIAMGCVINSVIFMEIMQSAILSLVMKVSVDLMSVIELSVIMVIEPMLSGMAMLLIVVLVSEMFTMVITVSCLMELGAMMQITVIRVHVFNQGLMVMHCLVMNAMTLMVWLSIEVMRFLIRVLGLNDDVMVQISLLVLQKVLLFGFIDAHALSVAWHEVAVKLAVVRVKVGVSVPGAMSVILGARLVESLLHLESLIESVRLLGW